LSCDPARPAGWCGIADDDAARARWGWDDLDEIARQKAARQMQRQIVGASIEGDAD